MRKYLKLFVLLPICALLLSLTGCHTTPTEPVVITKPITATPSDNLLVDCDVAPPPSKAAYLKPVTPGINPNHTLQKDDAFYLAEYIKTIGALEERERQLTEHALKQYQNLDACNKRWQQLREWKVTIQKLNTPQKE